MSPSSSNAPPTLPPHLTTHIHLLSPLTLNASPHLPALFALINHCFNISHNPPGHSYLPFSPTSRLKTHTQLSEETGPDGFTIIMLAQDTSVSTQVPSSSSSSSEEQKEEPKSNTVIATASAKPYIPPAANHNNNAGSEKLFKRQPGTDNALAAYAELPKWEILCMVVEPRLQGRGIAGHLMSLIIQEIKRRVRMMENETENDHVRGGGKGGDDDENDEERGKEGGFDEAKEGGYEGGKRKGKGKGEVLLMLSSLQELNESYYQKRGWSTTNIKRFPKGTMGSQDGFGVVEMMKIIPLSV